MNLKATNELTRSSRNFDLLRSNLDHLGTSLCDFIRTSKEVVSRFFEGPQKFRKLFEIADEHYTLIQRNHPFSLTGAQNWNY